MTERLKLFIGSLAIVALAACSTIEDKTRKYSAEAAARLLIGACAFSADIREKNRDAVTAKVAELGHPYQAVAQDCVAPHDGAPDF